MTRRCEIDKIGVDLPCMRRAPHFLKIMSMHLGQKGKLKIWLCDTHHKILQEKDQISELLDESAISDETSDKYTAYIK